MVLHPLKDDDTVLRRLNVGIADNEVIVKPEELDLVFEQTFDRLLKRPLELSDTDSTRTLSERTIDESLCKEMRLCRTAPAIGAFVTARTEQRSIRTCRLYLKSASHDLRRWRRGILGVERLGRSQH